jgi:AcrR family transcriptional regulator
VASEITAGRRTDAVANHARILAAARAVLAERGLDMEVHDVAVRAAVGVGTLYRHFANRDDLVRAVLRQTFEDMLARLRGTAEIADPAVALREIPLALTADQALFAVMQDPRAPKLLGDMKKHVSKSLTDEVIDLVAGIVERGMRSGAFRADLDPPTTAAAILGSIGVTCEILGARRPLSELAVLLADLHSAMVGAR